MVTASAAAGIDPRWSRDVRVPSPSGDSTWHVLDTHADRESVPAEDVDVTLLCVHGNPTSSYLFRSVLAVAPPRVRVIAVDQLGMGWSQRTAPRRLGERVDDLARLVTALGVRGPIVTVAHDWGGPISLGWVLGQLDVRDDVDDRAVEVAGVVLLNTAVHQPAGSPAPWLIRSARLPGVRWLVARATRGFLRGTLALSPQLPREVVRGYLDPYPTVRSREAIDAFIADIPLSSRHPSRATLDDIATRIGPALRDVPVLLLWGPRDPVFSDRYLHDLVARLPHADVHRYPRASHLVLEDAPEAVEDLMSWLHERVLRPSGTRIVDASSSTPVDLSAALRRRAHRTPVAGAIREAAPGHPASADRVITWAELAARIDTAAQDLRRRGVRPGQRVAILIPPGAAAVCAVYACWEVGAVVVIVDRGLGIAGMRRTLRGVGIDHAIGTRAGLLLARSISIRSRITVRDLLDASGEPSSDEGIPGRPGDEPAAIVFTSGSTGPAKGVRYSRGQVHRTCTTLVRSYALDDDDVLVAAFAPWAILGPALGLASVIPAMDLLRPSTLSARALAQAVARGCGTVLWASPAALRNVVDSASALSGAERAALGGLRLVLAAGAPVSTRLLEAAAELLPGARIGTPYGMTEVLPVTAVWLDELRAAGAGPGVLVGRAVPGVEIAIDARATVADGEVDLDAPGEILVRADHMRDGYHHLWGSESRASRPSGWHRTGDVGTLDVDGRLWLGGRLAHVISSDRGPVLPVEVEQRVETLTWVRAAAAVGVGPHGVQQVVVIVVEEGSSRSSARVALDRVREVRQAAGVPVAAVLRRDSFPLDVRHQAKIDRTSLSRWAERVLAGR